MQNVVEQIMKSALILFVLKTVAALLEIGHMSDRPLMISERLTDPCLG